MTEPIIFTPEERRELERALEERIALARARMPTYQSSRYAAEHYTLRDCEAALAKVRAA